MLHAARKYDPLGGAVTLPDVLRGARLYALLDHAWRPAAVYALRRSGAEMWATAAAGRWRGVDLVRTMLPFIEEQARQAGAIRVCVATKRRGLLRKLARAGYVDGGPYGIGRVIAKEL